MSTTSKIWSWQGGELAPRRQSRRGSSKGEVKIVLVSEDRKLRNRSGSILGKTRTSLRPANEQVSIQVRAATKYVAERLVRLFDCQRSAELVQNSFSFWLQEVRISNAERQLLKLEDSARRLSQQKLNAFAQGASGATVDPGNLGRLDLLADPLPPPAPPPYDGNELSRKQDELSRKQDEVRHAEAKAAEAMKRVKMATGLVRAFAEQHLHAMDASLSRSVAPLSAALKSLEELPAGLLNSNGQPLDRSARGGNSQHLGQDVSSTAQAMAKMLLASAKGRPAYEPAAPAPVDLAAQAAKQEAAAGIAQNLLQSFRRAHVGPSESKVAAAEAETKAALARARMAEARARIAEARVEHLTKLGYRDQVINQPWPTTSEANGDSDFGA